MVESITNFDMKVLYFIHDKLHPMFGNFILGFMKIITHMADSKVCPIYPVIFLAIGIAVYIRRNKANALDEAWRPKFDFAKMGLMMGVALLIGLIICNLTLKPLIFRVRPYANELFMPNCANILMIEKQSDASFPSGHTVAVFEMAFAVTYYCAKKKRAYWGIVAYVLAVLIAFSRLYVGVHYPSDVIAGAVIGTVSGILSVIIVNAIYKKFIDDKIYKPVAK